VLFQFVCLHSVLCVTGDNPAYTYTIALT
jgi:hypothetical protein